MKILDHCLVMGTIHRVLKIEKILKTEGIEVDTLVTPREISADCGMVVTICGEDLDRILALATETGYPPVEVWRLGEGKYEIIRSQSDDPS